MEQEKAVHLGNNIRKIRLIRGMKQATFAKEMGIAQQNISKMENKKKVSDEQMEQVAKILNTTVEAIKNFNENAVIQNNLFNEIELVTGNYYNPITEVLAYFKEQLNKKDGELEKLRNEIESMKNGESKKPTEKGATEPEKKMKAL